MPKSKISEKDILKKDTYRSILNLLEEFELQINEDGIVERIGLTHGQLLIYLHHQKQTGKKLRVIYRSMKPMRQTDKSTLTIASTLTGFTRRATSFCSV